MVTTLLLQLTALTHLHVAHHATAPGIAAGETTTVLAGDSGDTAADHNPLSCPTCLLRAQSHSIAIWQAYGTLPVPSDACAVAVETSVAVDPVAIGVTAPRGPPARLV